MPYEQGTSKKTGPTEETVEAGPGSSTESSSSSATTPAGATLSGLRRLYGYCCCRCCAVPYPNDQATATLTTSRSAHLLQHIELTLVGIVEGLARILDLVEGLVRLRAENRRRLYGYCCCRCCAVPYPNDQATATLTTSRSPQAPKVEGLARILDLVEGLVRLRAENRRKSCKYTSHRWSRILTSPRAVSASSCR
jgi:hypothetical protein